MCLKELVQQAIKNIIQKQTMMNLNSRFLFIKILKNINEQDSIYDLADLKTMKFIKDKSYKKITDEVHKIAIKKNINLTSQLDNSAIPIAVEEHGIPNVSQPYTPRRSTVNKNQSEILASNTPSIGLDFFGEILEDESSSDLFLSVLVDKYKQPLVNKNGTAAALQTGISNIIEYASTSGIDFTHINNSIMVERVSNTLKTQHSTVGCNSSFNLIKKQQRKSIKSNAIGGDSFCTDISDVNLSIVMKNNITADTESIKAEINNSTDSEVIILSSLHCNIQNPEKKLSPIEEHVFSSFSDLTLDDFNKTNRSMISSSYADCNTSNISNSVSVKKKKKYVPGYRTAAYAILKALNQYNGSHKHLVVLRATPFTDAEFDRSQKFSAFSAFKLLEKKALIVCNSESKIFLTDEGLELCKTLFFDETQIKENTNKEITLIVDSREKRNNVDRNYFQTYFTSKKIPNQTRYLALGDFIWIRNEKLLDFIVERKQSTDFVSSVSDGRYKEQKKRLISLGLNVFYLVENLKVDESRKKFIHRCLLEIRIQGFVLLETESVQESARLLEDIDKMIRDNNNSLPTSQNKGFGYGSFLEEANKNKLVVHDMLVIALLSVKGMWKEMAIALAAKYRTLSYFTSKINNEQFKVELMSFKLEGRGVCAKLANRLIEMLR